MARRAVLLVVFSCLLAVPAEAAFDLEAARVFPVGDRPFSLCRGDFDSDGIEDLAFALRDAGSVAVLLGNGSGGMGDGTFRAGWTGQTAEGPRNILTADFNEDGILDLAVTHILDSSVGILIGRGAAGSGDGTFDAPVLYPARNGPTWLASGDFNADGILDLAVANLWDGCVSTLLGDGTAGVGDGTFGPRTDYPVGDSPNCVIAADFDEDGILDLAAADMVGDAVRILFGNGAGGAGDGTFSPGGSYVTGSGTACVVAADFDGDGITDLAAANYVGATISVLMGNGVGGVGDGTFRPAVSIPAGEGPPQLTAGDFDGDGKVDLAVTDYRGNAALLFRGEGDGGFETPLAYTIGAGPEFLLVGDYNEDGLLDLASANATSDNATVLLGLPEPDRGAFRAAAGYGAGLGPFDLTTGDFNSDGYPDAAVADSLADKVRVLLSDGTGAGFLPRTTYPGGLSPVAIACGDFDGDGILDLVLADYFDDAVRVLRGNGEGGRGDGTFQPSVRFPTGLHPRGLLVQDLDENGILDLVTADAAGGSVSVLLGNGSAGVGDGTFRPPVSYAVGLPCWDVEAGDLDGDGILDLVAACRGTGEITVLFGNGEVGVGDGTFGLPAFYGAGSQPAALEVAFLDGDAYLDVAVACDEADAIAVLPGLGNGALGAALLVPAGDNPGSLCVSDLDLDGRPDLITADRNTCTMTVALSDSGGGSYRPALGFNVAEIPSAVVACDLDLDGLPDLLAAAEAAGQAVVLRNLSGGGPTSVRDPLPSPGPRAGALRFHPNPLAGKSTAEFSITHPGVCRAAIYDVTGRAVRELLSGPLAGGSHEIAWDGCDAGGNTVAPGLYFCQLATPAGPKVGRILVVR